MSKYCLGVDVGGTTIKCGIFTAEGELLDKWEVKTRTENNGDAILPDAAKALEEKLAERGIAKSDVLGVGVGVPGPVNSKGEIQGAVNLNWGYRNIAKEMSDLMQLPAKAGNDANVAALGEMWKGGGVGTNNLVMVTLGTGVGGGIIVDGKIVAGAHGAGGEIGHACVDPEETAVCNCGNRGCLEQMASATGIVRLGRQELEKAEEKTILSAEDLSAKSIFDAYKEDDVVAKRIVDRFAQYLGNALAVIGCVVDPEVFVIGGGVSKAGEVLIDAVKPYYKRDAFMISKEVPIVLAKLGNDAGIYGAARLAME